MTSIDYDELFDAQGRRLDLGAELGRGGEATVFKLASAPSQAVKLYHQPDATRLDKLKAMITKPPRDPTARAGHLSLAWPQELVFDGTGQGVGFVMPYVGEGRTLPLHQLYNPKARRLRAGGTTWQYLVRIARNLCAVVAALHRAGYVIGDLNESNILITDRALVSLVDCDSVQVRDGARFYRCLVGKGEYTAPELQGKAFKVVTRRPKHDTFALAVLIFLLLMEGVHPFAGVYRGEGEPPSTLQAIRRRRSPFLGTGHLEPAPGAPPFHTLPKELRRLFKGAFSARFSRPSAARWQEALGRLEQILQRCNVNAQHCYSAHLKTCPWCERTATLGLEAFPASTGAPTPKQASSPVRAPILPSYFRGSLWTWLKAFVVTASLLMLASGLMSYLLLLLFNQGASAGLVARPSLSIGFFLLTAFGLIVVGHQKTRGSSLFYKRLRGLERLARASLGSVLLASALSFTIGTLTGSGNVFEGDWLLLPSLWLLSFWLFWRHLHET